jgi:hypothetical protein
VLHVDVVTIGRAEDESVEAILTGFFGFEREQQRNLHVYDGGFRLFAAIATAEGSAIPNPIPYAHQTVAGQTHRHDEILHLDQHKNVPRGNNSRGGVSSARQNPTPFWCH